jgi:hypothetical protein
MLEANGTMRSPVHHGLSAAAVLAMIALASTTAAAADAPVYKDAERAGIVDYGPRRAPEIVIETEKHCCAGGQGHRRPVNGGPGYVGSVRGLGRPSYDGVWPPPGYGSYREHPFD